MKCHWFTVIDLYDNINLSHVINKVNGVKKFKVI